MSLNSRPGKRNTLLPTVLPNPPITEGQCPDDKSRCPEVFPQCPNIRCRNPIHIVPGKYNLCHAVGQNPYWAVYWEPVIEGEAA